MYVYVYMVYGYIHLSTDIHECMCMHIYVTHMKIQGFHVVLAILAI